MTDAHGKDDSSEVLVFDPEEPIVTFFFRLPETLSIPEFEVFREKLHASVLPFGWLEEGTEAEEWSGTRDYTNTWVFGSSVIVHQVKVSFVGAIGLDAIMKAVAVGIRGPGEYYSGEPLDQEADCTVLEVAMPAWVNLLAYRDRLKLSPGLDVRATEGIVEENIEFFFDVAIERARSLQMSYHAVRNTGLTLLTAEILPPVIPYLIRKSHQIAAREEVELKIHYSQRSFNFVARGEDLSREEIRQIFAAGAQVQQNPLASYLDLDREAYVSLRRSGNTRVAVVMVAASCEVILDRTLLMLHWEEKWTPESVARSWRESLKRRVELDFSSRLGGSWDLTKDNPLGRWAKKVAQVRNRVVHGGYLPTREEAEQALDVSHALVTFIADRLVDPRIVKVYPRSAMMLLGNNGLAKRGRYTEELRALQADPAEPPWGQTFGLWYKAFSRLRGDALTPRRSSLTEASLIAVYFPDDWPVYVAHDDSTAQAAKISIPEELDLGVWRESVQEIFEEHSLSANSQNPISILFLGGSVEGLVQVGPWVEEYHLIPLRGVMVDWSNFTVPIDGMSP